MAKIRSEQTGTQNQTELLLAVGKLQGTVETGFQAVNDHFGRLNGQVKKHGEEIEALKSSRAEGQGEKKGMATFWAIGITILSGCAFLLDVYLRISGK